MSTLNQQENRPQVIIVKTQKSVGVAILLTILFGPLGMFYSTTTGGVVMLLITVVFGLITLGFSLFITWPICVIWAAISANDSNNSISAQNPVSRQPSQNSQEQAPVKYQSAGAKIEIEDKQEPYPALNQCQYCNFELEENSLICPDCGLDVVPS